MRGYVARKGDRWYAVVYEGLFEPWKKPTMASGEAVVSGRSSSPVNGARAKDRTVPSTAAHPAIRRPLLGLPPATTPGSATAVMAVKPTRRICQAESAGGLRQPGSTEAEVRW